jgi:hypothetical protein
MAPKKSNTKTPETVSQAAPVEVAKPVESVKPVEVAPVKKGGAKKVEPVAPVVAAPAVVAPVKEAAPKKGGAKKVAEAAAVAPAVVAPVVQEAAPAKKGGAKKAAAPAKEVAPVAAPVVQEAGAKAAKVAKVAKAPKVPKAPKVAKVVEEEGEEGEEGDADDKTRSFKVLLPNQEEYSGRFTGLTPYQAANKALSKFFRTLKNEDVSQNITFSIRESTRGSKRNTYSYKGGRIKLATPIKYSIKSQEGEVREIVKEYKNQLVKVKKAEMNQEAPVVAVAPVATA